MTLVIMAAGMGMTYKEDLVNVKNHINELIKKGEYPEKLWK